MLAQDPKSPKSPRSVSKVHVTVTEDGHKGDAPSPRVHPEAHPAVPRLRNEVPLVSATGFPDFTNFVRGFVEVLDYVMVEKDRVEVLQVGALPDRETASRHTALPSPVFPSDHLAVMVDVTLR